MASPKWLATVVVLLGITPGAAWAQERVDVAPVEISPAFVSAIANGVRFPDLEQIAAAWPKPAPRPERSAVLGGLYVSTAVFQGLDVHSTIKALGRGAAEANPIMAKLTTNRLAFAATKAAVAAATILAARRIARQNRVAAIATLVAINSAYALVVRHNYGVARRR